jgi:hypothetical protein
VFVRELKRGGKKGEGELLEQRCLRKRKRRGRKGEGKTKEEEKRKRGCRPKWREREKKRKERGRDKVMCHHVSSWEKMRQSSPSQSGVDTWQWRVTFYLKTQTFINCIRTPLY